MGTRFSRWANKLLRHRSGRARSAIQRAVGEVAQQVGEEVLPLLEPAVGVLRASMEQPRTPRQQVQGSTTLGYTEVVVAQGMIAGSASPWHTTTSVWYSGSGSAIHPPSGTLYGGVPIDAYTGTTGIYTLTQYTPLALLCDACGHTTPMLVGQPAVRFCVECGADLLHGSAPIHPSDPAPATGPTRRLR